MSTQSFETSIGLVTVYDNGHIEIPDTAGNTPARSRITNAGPTFKPKRKPVAAADGNGGPSSRFATVDVLTPQLEALADAIEQSNLTVEQIAKRSRVDSDQLQSFLDGDLEALTPDELAQVQVALDTVEAIAASHLRAEVIRNKGAARIRNTKTPRVPPRAKRHMRGK